LYQVLGILRLATQVVEDEAGRNELLTSAWMSLSGAEAILNSIIDRLESADALMDAEAPPRPTTN
jgi:hypothetical protein